MKIFSEEIKEILAIVPQLRAVGEVDLAKKLCRKCVENVSIQNNTDLLELFYGNSVYDKLDDESDAMTYIFMARCLSDLYNIILPKISWGKNDSRNSNAAMRAFFEWLTKLDRKPSEKDVDYLKKALMTLTQSDVVSFKVAEHIKNFTLIEIVPMLVNGIIHVSSSGELI